jgi:hypothetical protein
MRRVPSITTLLLEIGGVLLTNGWDPQARRRPAMRFETPKTLEFGAFFPLTVHPPAKNQPLLD